MREHLRGGIIEFVWQAKVIGSRGVSLRRMGVKPCVSTFRKYRCNQRLIIIAGLVWNFIWKAKSMGLEAERICCVHV